MITRNVKKIYFLDFDGTLTNRSGRSLIYETNQEGKVIGYSEFYASLFKTNLIFGTHLYSDTSREFKSRNNMFEIMGVTLMDGDPRLMNKSAKTSLKEILKENGNVFIITLNRKEYVDALLEFEGFTTSERNQIEIQA